MQGKEIIAMRIENPEKVELVRITADNIEEHIDNIMKWANDPQITLYFAGMQKIRAREEELGIMKEIVSNKSDAVYSIFNLTGEYLGQVSVNKIDWIGETGRMFLVIESDKQGMDYSYATIKAIQDVFFMKLKLNKLWLMVRYESEMRDNYGKCGFKEEGILEEEYKVGDIRYDMVRMAITRKRWEGWWQ